MNPLNFVNLLEIAILVALPALFLGREALLRRLEGGTPAQKPDTEKS